MNMIKIQIICLFCSIFVVAAANNTGVSSTDGTEIYLHTLIRNYERRLYLIESRHEKDIRSLELKHAYEINRLEEKLLEQDQPKGDPQDSVEVSGGSSTYIRWGRKSCESGAELIYQGYAAGSLYSHAGGGANHVCLTNRPKWEFSHLGGDSGTYLYGSEYQHWPLKGDNVQGGSLIHHDVPCAACKTMGRSSVLMIPGTFQCPDDWHEEYHGYIVSSHHGHQKSDYVCLDSHPEAISGGHSTVNGVLLYYTIAKCGALPCPPYFERRGVTCVVCSSK